MSTDATLERSALLRVTDLMLDLPGINNPSLSFEVDPGTSLAVSGPSGTGKTSLLAVLAGLAAPADGAARWGDTLITTSDDAHRRRVGYIQQGYGLVATLTALENVAVPLLGRSPGANAWATARAALAGLGLDDQANQLVDRMSGGQQQRVAVARALAADPDLILADEPTSELDATSREAVLETLFARQRDRRCTLIIATHDPDVAERCDHQLRLGAEATQAGRGRHRANAADPR